MKIVTYDLNAPGRDYKSLLDEIRKMRAVRITESCWLIDYSGSSLDLTNLLLKKMDKNDRIFVSDINTNNSAWFNLLINNDQTRTFLTSPPRY